MPVVELRGCRSQPLGSYLKALGILRLVSRQKDQQALGWWDQDCFRLESELGERELLAFFLEEYTPTPVVAPWNGGSGFYPKDRKVGIEGIASSQQARFATYRQAIAVCRALPEVITGKSSKAPEEEKRRMRIQRACRNYLPETAVEWLDAAVAVTAEEKRAFPPILGTGGNEGRLDYTNNFMENLVRLLIKPTDGAAVAELLANALFGTPAAGLEKAAVGQYDPGRAGGFNQGQEVETKDIPVNPWNSVLTIEGAIAWASGLHRRQGAYTRAYLASPFTVYPSPVGFNSAVDKDQNLARAEIWAPLWKRPATYPEIEILFREGRAELKRGPAQNGLQFAQAAASLGVERGISGFTRFSLLKRRGDSYVALPAGRFPVTGRIKREADLLEQSAPLVEAVDRRFGRDAPASVAAARRYYDDAVYQFLLRGDRQRFWRVAAALGRLQREMLTRPGEKRVWLSPELEATWIEVCGERAVVRLAAALARIYGLGPYLRRGSNSFSWEGSSLSARMASVLARRLMDARRSNTGDTPVRSDLEAPITDIACFLNREIDEVVLEDLMFAFTLVRRELPNGFWEEWRRKQGEDRAVPAAYCLLRLPFDSAVKTPTGEPVKPEPRVVPLLQAGRVTEACRLAERRLRVSGLTVTRAEYSDQTDGLRLAAALLIPVHGIEWQARLAGVLRDSERR